MTGLGSWILIAVRPGSQLKPLQSVKEEPISWPMDGTPAPPYKQIAHPQTMSTSSHEGPEKMTPLCTAPLHLGSPEHLLDGTAPVVNTTGQQKDGLHAEYRLCVREHHRVAPNSANKRRCGGMH